ncbi:MAG TPA: hypothetical protein VJA19_17660, partial [Pseudomonas sp.]|nr:hypothetical protein [Pseudomonas sp.]
EKLTVINANIQIIGAKLGELSLKDSAATLNLDEVSSLTLTNGTAQLNLNSVGVLRGSNSGITQGKALNVSDLQLTGGSWNQGGFALNADSYKLGGSTLQLNGVFNQAIDELVVDGYTAELSKSTSWSKVRVINGGKITTPVASGSFIAGITLTADTIEVDATSFIDVSGKGSLPSPAVGNHCGGSHGGLGGRYASCTTNPVYGEYLAPTGFGMGGRYSGTSTQDTRGGGALKLVSRSLILNGKLLANGSAGANGYTVGGGSGGSLWVDTQLLFGSATTRIAAQGGNGRYSGGAGGGGRIAIYYAGLQGFDPLSQISVAAGIGAGATAGGVGSLHLENRVVSTAVADTNLTGFINREVSAFTVDFINAVLPESVTTEQVQLIGPNGLVNITGISALNTVRYQFQLDGALVDGAYELRVGPGIRSAQGRGMDQNGNGIEAEAQDVFVRPFVVDNLLPQAPVVSSPLVAPALNALTVRKASLSGTRESQTAILVNGVQQVALGDGAWSIANHALVEGESELKVQARDKAGNLSPATVLRFSVDSVSPSLQQYSHNSSALKQAPVSVWVRFNETGSGLDFANSSLTLKRAGAVISGQLTQDADLLSLTPGGTLLEGAYTVEVRLKDKVGNLSSGSFSFTLDYTPPAAPLLNAYPAVTVNKLLPIAGSKEAGSTLRVRNAANAQLTSICCSASTWQYSLTLEPGDNLFSLDQTDAAGNVSPRTELRVRFDNQAPGAVTFVIDPKGSGTELNLAWPAYDEAANGNDIQQYRVYSAAQPFTQVASAQLLMSVPGGTRKALVNNLARAELRHFAVVAVDQQGLLLDQIASQAATPQDVQAPEDPLGLGVVSLAERLDLAWQASPNKAGDLAGYALYVGASDPQRIDLPLSALAAGLRYSLADLDPASANPLRLVAVDGDGNESAGQRNAGITLLANPQGLQLQAFANRFEATWSAVQPGAWVSGYRLYVADAPFTSVQGMTPKLLSGAAQTSASVAGLLNDKTYHVAVSVVNASGGENPQVQSVSVKPQADGQGPVLTQLSWNAAAGAKDL